jgi:hypothetical protein
MSLTTRDDSLVAGRGIEPVKVFDSGGRRNTVVLNTLLMVSAVRSSSEPESESIARAKDVVDDYWSADPQHRYDLLSRNYRQQLQRSRRITSAQQYARATAEPGRIWRERIYQEFNRSGSDFVRIKVLVGWEQEGYEGVMTFIFELVREQGMWKIRRSCGDRLDRKRLIR